MQGSRAYSTGAVENQMEKKQRKEVTEAGM